MMHYLSYHRRKIRLAACLALLLLTALAAHLAYVMIFRSAHYMEKADDLHERERTIKAARGEILDRNGTVLASNRTVCTVSVIHNQITEPDRLVSSLAELLKLPEEEIRKKAEKRSSREIIRTNVDKQTGDQIRALGLDGVKVDEDYKRYYPYGSLASKVLGFTGGDNQGVIGLEVMYEKYLKGTDGKILTLSDARGVELENAAEGRIEPIPGASLTVSLDVNIQKYAEQAAYQVMEKKGAKAVSVILMDPRNGEIYAMVNAPEFDLNDPFASETDMEALNKIWRNRCVSDTYEPGSTFKIITAAAGLEEGVVTLADRFSCPGFRIVEDRKIRCHKVGGHGSETFLEGAMNSCNPVFIDVGQRIGAEAFYRYFGQFGLLGKTGIDLPGEAATIMHKKENIGLVELATISFGQSFQVTPIQLITTAASIVNGGNRVTPHFAIRAETMPGGIQASETAGAKSQAAEPGGETAQTAIREFTWPVKEGIVSEKTSETMRYLLEQVVANGSGRKAQVAGFRIGGKTATSEKLPRSLKKYISSFIGFAPADDPQVIALITIDEPVGIYYGGTIAAPVIADIFEKVLPYMGIEFGESMH